MVKARILAKFACLRIDLLNWWNHAARTFPWRQTRNPYHIFLAETLLHRTRANQVVTLYEHTIRAYPTIQHLATADPEVLHKLLHSAGLRWRIDRLAEGSRYIMQRFSGEIPESRADLETIPGVGHYIAAAVRCFAFGTTDAIIDTNVIRVYGRVFEISVTDRLRRDPSFHKLAQFLMDPENPRSFNLALLDLAAAICTPRNPKCEQCPISRHCVMGSRVLGLNQPPWDFLRSPAGVPVFLDE